MNTILTKQRKLLSERNSWRGGAEVLSQNLKNKIYLKEKASPSKKGKEKVV